MPVLFSKSGATGIEISPQSIYVVAGVSSFLLAPWIRVMYGNQLELAEHQLEACCHFISIRETVSTGGRWQRNRSLDVHILKNIEAEGAPSSRYEASGLLYLVLLVLEIREQLAE